MKRILLILSILSIALTGNTQLQQMWLGGQTGGGGAGTNLDGYSFDAVYALENLYSSWVGNDVVLVRRISDNTESGFTSTEVSDGTLASFCTGTNCVVKTIYDQSGNTNDVIQTSASLQPLIAVSGTVLTSNGKPAIYFDGSNDQAVGSSETAISVFVVAANDGLTTANYVCSFPTAGILGRHIREHIWCRNV